jgi:hypothetical protein
MPDDIMAANPDAAIDSAPEGVAAPTPEDITTTQAFSKRLNEKVAEETARLEAAYHTRLESESKAFDTDIAALGMEWNGKPITTRGELRQAQEAAKLEAEAAKQRVPVEILSELQSTKSTAQQALDKLSRYERQEAIAREAETLSADPKWGAFFKANEPEIRQLADRAKVDLDTAKLVIYDRIGPQDAEAIANKAIQDFLDKKRTLNKPTEGSGATPVTVQAAPKTFDEARKNAMAYLDSLRE